MLPYERSAKPSPLGLAGGANIIENGSCFVPHSFVDALHFTQNITIMKMHYPDFVSYLFAAEPLEFLSNIMILTSTTFIAR